MDSPSPVIPAGWADGPKPQMGLHKALPLDPSSMLKEGSKGLGGLASQESPKSPKGVHSPEGTQGGLGPMASDPNPSKEPQMGTKHPAPLSGTQFLFLKGCWDTSPLDKVVQKARWVRSLLWRACFLSVPVSERLEFLFASCFSRSVGLLTP